MACGGALVDHALGGGAVVRASRVAGAGLGGVTVTASRSRGDLLGRRLEGAADRLVALAAVLVLAVALDLRLDVGHGRASLPVRFRRSSRAGPMRRARTICRP